MYETEDNKYVCSFLLSFSTATLVRRARIGKMKDFTQLTSMPDGRVRRKHRFLFPDLHIRSHECAFCTKH